MALEALMSRLPAPRKAKHTGTPEAWTAAERALGVLYPPDFKAYLTVYGSGTVGGVINVFNPLEVDWSGAAASAARPTTLAALLETLNPFGTAEEQWLYALASTLAVSEQFPTLALPDRERPVAVRLWPELPGLFPWAQGDSGQALLWWVEGEADQYPTVLVDPTEGLVAYREDMTGLLAGWLAGTVELAYLPPAGKPLFR